MASKHQNFKTDPSIASSQSEKPKRKYSRSENHMNKSEQLSPVCRSSKRDVKEQQLVNDQLKSSNQRNSSFNFNKNERVHQRTQPFPNINSKIQSTPVMNMMSIFEAQKRINQLARPSLMNVSQIFGGKEQYPLEICPLPIEYLKKWQQLQDEQQQSDQDQNSYEIWKQLKLKKNENQEKDLEITHQEQLLDQTKRKNSLESPSAIKPNIEQAATLAAFAASSSVTANLNNNDEQSRCVVEGTRKKRKQSKQIQSERNCKCSQTLHSDYENYLYFKNLRDISGKTTESVTAFMFKFLKQQEKQQVKQIMLNNQENRKRKHSECTGDSDRHEETDFTVKKRANSDQIHASALEPSKEEGDIGQEYSSNNCMYADATLSFGEQFRVAQSGTGFSRSNLSPLNLGYHEFEMKSDLEASPFRNRSISPTRYGGFSQRDNVRGGDYLFARSSHFLDNEDSNFQEESYRIKQSSTHFARYYPIADPYDRDFEGFQTGISHSPQNYSKADNDPVNIDEDSLFYPSSHCQNQK